MSEKLKSVAIIGGVIGLLLIVLLAIPGSTVSFSVEETSDIKEGANVQLSSQNYARKNPLPLEIKLRPGYHSFEFQAKDAEPYVERRWILPFQSYQVTANYVEEEIPFRDDISDYPFLSAFPILTNDYEVSIVIAEKDSKRQPIEIKIRVLHRFTSPEDGAAYQEEKDLAVAAAKKQLQENSVPETIPVTVIE